jgi:FAD/FMN-containing dehydrogenase
MIFYAQSNEDISQFLRNRSRSPLHISGGEKDSSAYETISLSKINHILFYEPQEMIISVQAGIRLDELQKILAEKNQWIPTLHASEVSEATLGAAVAMDHFHPRTLTCGALRTAILGGTFCTTKGEIFKSGSRVVKSVAGYDIHRAFCGSRGRFGIILDLTLKVQPLPEMFYHFYAPKNAHKMLLQFHPTCIEEHAEKLLVELSGYKEDVIADTEEVKSSGIHIEELKDNTWNSVMKELIYSQDREKEKKLEPFSEELMNKVKRVFDPENILVSTS